MDPLVQRARQIAYVAHEGQTRLGGRPYFTHVEVVAQALANESPEVQAVAYLHDVIEIGNLTRDDLISQGMPSVVADGVSVLTRLATETYVEYIMRVRTNELALKVKPVDIRVNVGDPHCLPSMHRRYQRALALLIA
jgi:(p)ppGpp synthase/HD superfamily hydrolase